MLKRKDFFGSNSINETSDKVNIILSGTEITGDIVSNSNLLIEGEVNGNISCSGKVQIGTSGKIKGNLVCVNADVEGALDGELTIENLLILRSTARIKGDIQTLKLNIEEGAFFEGACVMKSPVSTNNTFNADIAFD
jgi:cytoskeletal protein CcmA (bactofilin family)